MGQYNYLLTTKTRKLTDQHGRKVDAHLYRFSDKESSYRGSRGERLLQARIQRSTQIWDCRDWPEFVISDPEQDVIDYDNSDWPVYEACKTAYFGEEHLSKYAIFAGYVRGKGGKNARLQFERWCRFTVRVNNLRIEKQMHEMRMRLHHSGFVESKNVHIGVNILDYGNPMLVVSAKTENDLVKAKVVLADMIADVREDKEAA